MNKLKFALFGLFLSASSAFAQTAPNWTQGYVPSPAEWNAVFAGKQDYLGSAPLLVNGGTMTGELITAPSATSSAGFNVSPGVAPTSPVNGDLWSTSAGFFVQVNGATIGPLTQGTGGSFAATPPITVTFPGSVVTYACATCGVTGSPLSQFASTTSAQLAGVISDETGTGSLVFGTSPTITTPSIAFGTGSSSIITAGSVNTGFTNLLNVQNGGTISNLATIAQILANLTGGTNAFLIMEAVGGASPQAVISTGTGLTGGLSINAGAGPLVITNPILSTATVTGSFTATGLVTYTDLVTGTQNSLLGYFGSTSASIASIPNCSGALIYSTGTNSFGCNSSAGTGTITQINQGANTTANPGNGVLFSTSPCIATCTATRDPTFERDYLAGCILSTAGFSATFSINACVTTDSTNATQMKQTSAYSKTTGAWAVGSANGGLDTGTVANNTWYHVYQIIRTDTGVVDYAFSLSASVPTTGGNIPSAYTLFRRIGSLRTNGSAQWVLFIQLNDEFLWSASVPDVAAATLTAGTPVLETLTVPTGIQVLAIIDADMNAATSIGVLVNSPDQAAVATPVFPNTNLVNATAGGAAAGHMWMRTNTSAQVRAAATATITSNFSITTQGWIDYRGRNL